MPTLEINNLGGPLTRKNNGDINSGLARFSTSWGYDPYSKPGNLTWMEQPTSILSGSIAGVIVTMKQRSEGTDNNYVYAISDNGIIRKITVNQPAGGLETADSDSPSVIGSFAFAGNRTGGGALAFYGTPEKLYVSGDTTVAVSSFTGASSSIIGDSLTAFPRPFANFVGKLYFGNGNNIGEIDSTDTIVSTAKLSPALPVGLVVHDLDVTPSGNYLQLTTTKVNPLVVNGGSPDGITSNATDSFKFYWNGVDGGVSAFDNYSGVVLLASISQVDKDYTFSTDLTGMAVSVGKEKILSLPNTFVPKPNAVFSNGTLIGFGTNEYETSSGRFRGAIYNYGEFDKETPRGLYRLLRHNAQPYGDILNNDDVLAIPACINVSNRMYTPQRDAYPNNLVGTAKVYYSTTESSSVAGGANIAKLWRFRTAPTGVASIVAGVYETQTQLFSKKVKIGEVRVYTEPLVGGNDFVVDLIGSGGSVISGGSQRFQVATGSVVTGTDMVQFNPAMAPTYAVGVRITNSSTTGVANWTGRKLEVDYEPAGK